MQCSIFNPNFPTNLNLNPNPNPNFNSNTNSNPNPNPNFNPNPNPNFNPNPNLNGGLPSVSGGGGSGNCGVHNGCSACAGSGQCAWDSSNNICYSIEQYDNFFYIASFCFGVVCVWG